MSLFTTCSNPIVCNALEGSSNIVLIVKNLLPQNGEKATFAVLMMATFVSENYNFTVYQKIYLLFCRIDLLQSCTTVDGGATHKARHYGIYSSSTVYKVLDNSSN